MSKDPAILFYTSDFLTGTQFFTDEQCGQYIRLLCQQHQLGHIPDKHMMDICHDIRNPVFTKFIKDGNGFWYNERMDLEKEKRIKYCESRRNNKMKEYNKPKTKQHMSKHMSGHMDNGNENDNIDINRDRIVKERDFEELWQSYPNKDGRSAAYKHFKATVTTEQDLKDIKLAISNYLKSEKVLKGFIKNGSTFFNNWKDWIKNPISQPKKVYYE